MPLWPWVSFPGSELCVHTCPWAVVQIRLQRRVCPSAQPSSSRGWGLPSQGPGSSVSGRPDSWALSSCFLHILIYILHCLPPPSSQPPFARTFLWRAGADQLIRSGEEARESLAPGDGSTVPVPARTRCSPGCPEKSPSSGGSLPGSPPTSCLLQQ